MTIAMAKILTMYCLFAAAYWKHENESFVLSSESRYPFRLCVELIYRKDYHFVGVRTFQNVRT